MSVVLLSIDENGHRCLERLGDIGVEVSVVIFLAAALLAVHLQI